ncbi:hypothetical protein DICPUDRAFT_36346 [Dictyostelium purpureum]|uniref:Proteasome activator PA28 C-terminal domain-containing protein n=1 Tax=Dictyostelium purpureum TaxID=5786 RepID=F0ZQW8_DICPU|nr:uncharacterized protein DICPUDRAFT_36346 [Dictyostelium purpureum]EGC33641.1 hypothetical protein DICPUDRAFT_36346 [Dictyostelium purpureum]|eukprot:XP_003289811.1 hypothetical protein DICPUDRAFT_36346 [Dictyostelium purpureum]
MSNKKTTEIKLDERVNSYKEYLYEKTLNYLKNVIPERIQEFHKLSQKGDENFKDDPIQNVLKKRKLESDNGFEAPSLENLMKINKKIIEAHTKLRKDYIEVIEIFSTIRAWIHMNIPRIEDGNNFGVDIQEDVVATLTKLEDVYTTLLETCESYFTSRAQYMKRALKYKEIDSYRHVIAQIDEKEFIKFNFAYFDLANNYSTTYSLIVKNFAKLEQPRPTNVTSSMF